MARKYKRDLETPLAESKFDPADYNKDGEVTMKEQKKYNKMQVVKAKGKAQVKNISANKKKSGATKGSGAKGVGTAVSTAVSTLAGIGGAVGAFRKPNSGSSNSAR